MRDPRQRPRVQQRIAIVVHAVAEMKRLRIGHHGGERREEEDVDYRRAPGIQDVWILAAEPVAE
jgi:hypothetical protein